MTKKIEKIWVGKQIDQTIAQELANVTKLPLATAKLMAGIGVKTKEEAAAFIRPDYLTQIHNPFDMRDMDVSIQRIKLAIERKEKILIHGDYDCDGVTTVAIAKEALSNLAAALGKEIHVDVFTPNRFIDGYGINVNNVERFVTEYDLIISGDTGIRAFEAAYQIKQSGQADLIVTDHHEPMEGHLHELFENFHTRVEKDNLEVDLTAFDALAVSEKMNVLQSHNVLPKEAVVEVIGDHWIALPDAVGVIDPQRLGDTYPCKTLAGVGVMFKVMHALYIEYKTDPKPLFYLLDYVATGSIADLAQQIDKHGETLDFEVRTMCKYGIQIMNEFPKVWVRAILEGMGVDPKRTIDSTTIGFKIGPLLNATGRIDDPEPAANLLLEKDYDKALAKATNLAEVNKERQAQTRSSETIIEELKEEGEERYDYGIVVQSNLYGIGIAGLVAGDLVKEFYRPSIALAPHTYPDGRVVLKGSARSIPGIHVLRVMDAVKERIGDYIYGGHEQAAGMTLEVERFEAFREAFREECMKHAESVFIPKKFYDLDLDFTDVSEGFIKSLEFLKPHGEGNNSPVFMAKDVEIMMIKPLKEGKYGKYTFRQNGMIIQGLMWSDPTEIMATYKQNLRDKTKNVVDILYVPEINMWNGEVNLQARVVDLRFKD